MSPANAPRFLTLTDREFRELTGKPAASEHPTKFKPIRLNPARFDQSRHTKRGAAVQLMTVVLREDHESLQRRVCATDQTAKTYAGAAAWLQRESAHLRKIARLLDGVCLAISGYNVIVCDRDQ
jgi:hypothetical protein